MDLAPAFNAALAAHNAPPISKPPFDPSTLNEFLQEAYRINAHITALLSYLREIRPAYLTLTPARRPTSTQGPAPLTDTQRQAIDADTRQLLSTLAGAITQLSTTARVSSELQTSLAARKTGFGALGRWAAGAGAVSKSPAEEAEAERVRVLGAVREGVVWYLKWRVESAGEEQRGMVEVWVRREVERRRSVLHSFAGPVAQNYSGAERGLGTVSEGDEKAEMRAVEEDGAALEAQLSPEQLQLFAREEADMLKQYSDELAKIKSAESSLLEISSLQTELALNLEMQSENITQLVHDSVFTAENVGSGNKELKRASERPSTARMVFWATCALCGFLVTWDLVI
ncbi:hypothetical protein EJ06DRAFT_541918 [Trichodelitschia bisporula]|uniref:SNARE-complex protein Syntaxin-18 N-terminal domain-containing protein n=1 Tax=Trichodelitschia bisporula TaxID=703511 RepID=A0A6G1I556_9PEZI|nr:hypothetical protein EJ06DRAFT_541918 [Trichodelitschia bisporula]